MAGGPWDSDMKKLLLALALLLIPVTASAQCNGVFPNNTLCGNVSGASNTPRAVPNNVLTGVPGGSTGQIQFNNTGVFGGFGPITGDIGLTIPGAVSTIQPSAVSNSKLATMPAGTLKGNSTGGAATPTDLTFATVLAALNVPPTAGIQTPANFSAICDGVTDDAVPLQNWFNAIRDGGIGAFTASESTTGCATSAPLLLQPSTNTAPVQGPQILGVVNLVGITGLGGSGVGTSSGTNLTIASIVGAVHIGDTITGGATPNNTHILSQTSGPTGGNGVYVTDQAAGISGAAINIVSDLLRIWNPTATTTSQNFYYPSFGTLNLSTPTSTVANCLSLRGYWGTITKVFGKPCHGGDLVQFPNYIFASIPDEYESNPQLGDLTCISCTGYVLNNLIGIGATPRAGNVRGTVTGTITTGLGAIFASGSELISGAIAYTGTGWAVTIDDPPVGGGSIQTLPHEIFMGPGAGDIDCAQNGVQIKNLQFGTVTGHRLNTEAAGVCNAAQWPLTAYSFGGGSGTVSSVTVKPYITVRPSYVVASTTLFDFTNDANISNLIVDVTISDQTGLIISTAFTTLYKNINGSATIRIIQNGLVMYDTITGVLAAGLPTCAPNTIGVRMSVSDSNATTFGATIGGGGTNKVPAFCNGTNWVVG